MQYIESIRKKANWAKQHVDEQNDHNKDDHNNKVQISSGYLANTDMIPFDIPSIIFFKDEKITVKLFLKRSKIHSSEPNTIRGDDNIYNDSVNIEITSKNHPEKNVMNTSENKNLNRNHLFHPSK